LRVNTPLRVFHFLSSSVVIQSLLCAGGAEDIMHTINTSLLVLVGFTTQSQAQFNQTENTLDLVNRGTMATEIGGYDA
jgi:hypothetical protein